MICPSCHWHPSSPSDPINLSDLIVKKIFIHYHPYNAVVSLTNYHPIKPLTKAYLRLSYYYSPYCHSLPSSPTEYQYSTDILYWQDVKTVEYNEDESAVILNLPDLKPNVPLYVAFKCSADPDPNFVLYGQEKS